MTKRVQWIGHITADANLFIGRQRELTVDITTNELRVHDGSTPGGHRILNKAQGDALYRGIGDAEFTQLVTDVIEELTGGSGITVDGVLIKDGLVDGIDVSNLALAVIDIGDDLTAHIGNTSNPHAVTKAQVGLANVTNDAQLKIASNLADLNNVTTARTNLGLGTLATQDADNVAITGGSISNVTLNVVPRGYLDGFIITGGQSDDDFTVQPGVCRDDADTATIKMDAEREKTILATWVAGTGGALDTGTVANNTTYHVHAILNPATGDTDVLISLSATAPTLPSGYTKFRRVGSLIYGVGAFQSWRQFEDYFYGDEIIVRSSTAALAEQNFAFPCPAGINCYPLIKVRLHIPASTNCQYGFGHGGFSGTLSTVHGVTGAGDSNDNQTVLVPPIFRTNTARQLRMSLTNSTGTATTADVVQYGWRDTRGRDVSPV